MESVSWQLPGLHVYNTSVRFYPAVSDDHSHGPTTKCFQGNVDNCSRLEQAFGEFHFRL